MAEESNSKNPHSIKDVVDGLEELAESEDNVRISDVLEKFGKRSFAPVMLVLALIEMSPVGVIPGVPSFLALCIALIAVQMLFGRKHIWVPDWIADRSVTGKKMLNATEKLEGTAGKLDAVAKGRMKYLARGPALRVAAAIIVLLCAMVPPLELLPWASAGPMIAIAIICLAVMARDGLTMLAAWGLASGGVIWAVSHYLSSDTAGSGLMPF